ncbi:MAG: ABC transporter ATP-binding protein [Peptococcaceae bacterium]|jgi:iron complex transport system ATP-binding protein|nr:ABC transporter ATP-binding protein [Peptococcaceae bacterium]
MLLEIENLSGGYGGVDVVQSVSCSASEGEILCLVGPNGCGKTTLFRLILGMIPMTGGSIRIDDKDIKALSQKGLARLIAYIPQQHTPIFTYTVLEIVLMGRASHFSAFETPRSIDRESAFLALEKLGVEHLANRKYTSLSGGQRQMVLIARAICQSAKIFIMDEPGASLDYANQQRLMDVVTDLAEKGYCVVMSTHSPEHPLSVGHKAILMSGGRVAAFGKPPDVITSENLWEIYGVEMDVISVEDRYGVKRTICLPVRNREQEVYSGAEYM